MVSKFLAFVKCYVEKRQSLHTFSIFVFCSTVVFLNLQLMGEMMGNIQMFREKLSEKKRKSERDNPEICCG